MKEKNCPNCGSPYDPFLNTCPYCGTSYFDLTSINLTDKQPVFLKIKTLFNNQPVTVTLFVKPELKSIEINTDIRYAYGGLHNSKTANFQTNQTVVPVISFTGIPFGNDNEMLMQIAAAE